MPSKNYLSVCLCVVLIFFSANGLARNQSVSIDELAAALIAAKTESERAALLEARKEPLTVELRKALLAEGDRFFEQRNLQKAFIAFTLARDIASRINDGDGLASALARLGNIHFAQNRPAQALDFYSQSLKLRQEQGDKTRIVALLTLMARVNRLQGNTDAALDHLQRGYALFDEVKDKTIKASLLNGFGLAYYAIADYVAALPFYEKALHLYEAGDDKAAAAGMLQNIGIIHSLMGDYDRALEGFQKTLTLGEAMGEKSLIAMSQNNIGNVYYARGNYRLAMQYYEKSLSLEEEAGNKAGAASSLGNIGQIHRLQGNHAQALNYLQKCLDLNQSLGNKSDAAQAINSLGFVYRDQGDYDKAADLFQQSMQLSREVKDDSLAAVSLNGLGTVYNMRGDYAKARDALERALAMHEKSGYKEKITTALCNLAFLHASQNRPEESLRFAQRAATLARELGGRESLWFALANKGRALYALNQIDEARKALDESIEVIETLRYQAAGGEVDQSRFFENKISVYHSMIELLVRQNNAGEALAYAERAKARVLLDTLQSGRAQITKAMTDEERSEERASNNEIYSLNAQLQRETLRAQPNATRLADLGERLKKARLDQQAFLTRLYAAHPDLKIQRGQTPAFSLAQASPLLDDQTALLEYVVTRNKTFLFVLTRQTQAPSLKVYELPVTRKELSAMAESFRETLASHNLVFRPAAARLYESLIKPAETSLRGRSKLVIVPDSALWELPFQALQTGRQRYLIEDSAIVYAPSLSVLVEMKKQREKRTAEKKPSTLLAFANPALGDEANPTIGLRGSALAPLPQAEAEAKMLAQVYGRMRSKVYVGAEATEERFKAEAAHFSRLHLATHGILNDRSPMYSQIVLSQSEGREDGLLEAWEIMQLDLATDLVVLSACETARGRISAGEGVIGLTWALFVAGSPSTLVSQWKVDASGTAELMLDFHRNLSARATKAESLRKATLKMLESNRYRHPFYWAAFVMTGDGF